MNPQKRTMTSPSECRYCGAEWQPGGEFHTPDCYIRTGILSTKVAIKQRKNAKARKYQSVTPVEDNTPRVDKLEGF